MSHITTSFRLALTAAALVAATATADAKPRRLVILDFDGPAKQAEAGRNAVATLLGDQYDIVAAKRWETARADASVHSKGPATWNEAARKAGVDAVIEGWVQSKTLSLLVRDASTGNEIDTVQVKIGDKGLTSSSTKELQTDLDNVLDWVDTSASDSASGGIPVIKVDRVMVGAKKTDKKHVAADDSTDDTADAKPTKHAHASDDSATDDETPAPPKRKHHADDKAATDDQAPTEAKVKKTAIGDEEPSKPKNDLLEIFGPDSKELTIADKGVVHVPQPTPRFEVSAGGYFGSRSLEFVAEDPPTEYPGTSSKGISLHAAFFPFPTQKVDGRLSGIGATFSLYHAVGSTVTSDEGDSVVDYTIDQSGWDVGLHYRLPIDMFNLDFSAFYGQDDYIISGASADFDVPDTSYRYVGIGAAVELQVTDRATIGFGAKLFDVLDTGDISQAMWYGPGGMSGIALNANFTVPLPQKMFVRGDLSYKRFTLEPDGSGDYADMYGVQSATDTTVNASVEIGVQF